MTEEDEAFNDIERQAKQRKESVRAAMLKVEDKWIETNNSVCALLRQAHDALALSSLPPRRTWVGLTRNEQGFVYQTLHNSTSRIDSFWVDFANAIEAKLKEKNA